FDPDDIDVWAVFTSPTRRTRRVNGFFYQPFRRRLNDQTEEVTAAGAPSWRVRFTPDEAGTWRVQLFARDRSGTTQAPPGTFISQTAPAHRTRPYKGFITRSQSNPRAFAWRNEKNVETPFFVIGENIGWAGSRGTYDYEDWLSSLSAAGGNFMRMWMASWHGALEWSREGKGERRSGTYHGVGIYSLDNAWKVDTILDTASRHGIATMLCFGTYGEFREGGFFNEGQWAANPYNIANGGPCATPAEFFTNEQARKLYRRRLRYIAARWGYDPYIHSWEFWNEQEAPAAWVGEMARYLKGRGEFAGQGADAFGHIISTTYGNAEVWKIPEIDYSMTHDYGMANKPDHATVIAADARVHETYGKPHLMAEFGIDWRKPDASYDEQGKGFNLHNGLWSSAMSGNAGVGLLWWWDNYVHPKNLYSHFRPISRFAETIEWTRAPWTRLSFDTAHTIGGNESFSDLVLPATAGWGKAKTENFVIGPRGLESDVQIGQFLYAPGKADIRTTPTFRFNLTRPAQLKVRVNTVSDNAKLRFLLDETLVREVLLDAKPPANTATKPEYEKTEFQQQHNLYQALFNRDYAIDVPAGAHTVRLENVGADWVQIDSVTLTNARSSRYPDINIYGIRNDRGAIVWIQNAASNWKTVYEKRSIPRLQNVFVPIRALPAQRYRVEWFDTWQGTWTRRENLRTQNGVLRLRVPLLETDVAVKLTAQ
ncbi:MAG: hypothetical protein JWN98_877, partial [Abditibacteriota bacterium]|nr:hypothetical protein [Abditibacteriota bacterium]